MRTFCEFSVPEVATVAQIKFNEVNLRRAQLVHGWLNHLDM